MSEVPQSVETEVRSKSIVSPTWVFVVTLLILTVAFKHTRPLVILLGMAYLASLVHLLGFVLMGALTRVPMEEIAINTGAILATGNLGKTRLTIRSFPSGGFVQFKGFGFSEENPGEDGFRHRGLLVRLAILGSASLATYILATVCLGSAGANHHFRHGVPEILLGAFAPFSQGQVLIGKALVLVEHKEWMVLLGIVAAKLTAYNLLPIPPFNGGWLLMELLRKRIERSEAVGKTETWTIVGTIGAALVFAGWIVALFRFVQHGF